MASFTAPVVFNYCVQKKHRPAVTATNICNYFEDRSNLGWFGDKSSRTRVPPSHIAAARFTIAGDYMF